MAEKALLHAAIVTTADEILLELLVDALGVRETRREERARAGKHEGGSRHDAAS